MGSESDSEYDCSGYIKHTHTHTHTHRERERERERLRMIIYPWV